MSSHDCPLVGSKRNSSLLDIFLFYPGVVRKWKSSSLKAMCWMLEFLCPSVHRFRPDVQQADSVVR